MSVTPQISIIIPVYNVEKYLRQCLDSIVNQSFTEIEIICVDDSSSDSSYKILKEYAEKDSRVQAYIKENEAVSMARNFALDKAIGEYIMFVDADDWIDEDCCEKVIKKAQETGCDVLMWDYMREFDGKSLKKGIFPNEVHFDREQVKDKLHRRMLGIVGEELSRPENADALCTIWGKLYRRDCIYDKNIRFYDIRKIGTYEDGLFNLDVFENAESAVYIPDAMYHYRKTNANSLTTEYKAQF